MADCECKHDGKIAMLEQRDQMIVDSLNKLEGKVDLILMQITKVAVLEVSHANQNEAIARSFKRIEDLEASLKNLSKESSDFISYTKGMAKMAMIMWGILTGAVSLLGIKIIFG